MNSKSVFQGTKVLFSQTCTQTLPHRLCSMYSSKVLTVTKKNPYFNHEKAHCLHQQFANYSADAESTENNRSPKNKAQERKKANTSLEATSQYRQNQLKKLNDKFMKESSNSFSNNSKSMSSWWSSKPLDIDKYEDVQPMWKDMESRVLKRRLPPKLSEVNTNPIARSVYVGRRNIRKTEEDEWLAAGLYDNKNEKK